MVADGGQAVTREGRLLSWASEVEAQLMTQRQDLRRARVELAAAQEVRAGGGAGRGCEQAWLRVCDLWARLWRHYCGLGACCPL